eukprot:GHVP01005969.1.p1 GENE.GHVP01005969.1~~GHVP01005969.1.p1  ORF type:complete len:1291 (-),score=191.39 GHVP01005969.1:123-3995(-)
MIQPDFNDCTSLPGLDEDAIISNLINRYKKDIIHTYASTTLIVLNPQKSIQSLYTTENMSKYFGMPLDSQTPHIYAIADLALRKLKHSGGQSIVISGESGAGKTVTSKHVLNYISCATQTNRKLNLSSDRTSKGAEFQRKLEAANPILEAFGNAKTKLNSNSSRFGRYNELFIDRLDNGLSNAKISHYLLERSRIVHHSEGERCFHIFYQVLQCPDKSLLKRLHLLNENAYSSRYLNQGKHSVCEDTDLDDGRRFAELLEAFKSFGFTTQLIEEIFRCVSAVMLLGSLTEDNECENLEEHAAENLGISMENLKSYLYTRVINGEHLACDFSRTMSVRNALMRVIYCTLFDFIVGFINEDLISEDDSKSTKNHSIGVLDIYGFENLRSNGMEQLMINLANERLQEFFVQKIIVGESECLKNEGIKIPHVEVPEAKPVLDVIARIFSILNDSTKIAISAGKSEEHDERFWKSLAEINSLDGCFLWRLFPSTGSRTKTPKRWRQEVELKSDVLEKTFVVSHFAGKVLYHVTGWVERNNDKISSDIIDLLGNSKFTIFKKLIPSEGTSRTSKFSSVVSNFSKCLEGLVKNLSSCDLHFVRCFSPNIISLPNSIDIEHLRRQIICSGVIEMVKVLKECYPHRPTYLEATKFIGKPTRKIAMNIQAKSLVGLYLEIMGVPRSEYALGIRRLFLRDGKHEMLLSRSSEILPIQLQIQIEKKYLIRKFNATVHAVSFLVWLKSRWYPKRVKRRKVLTEAFTKLLCLYKIKSKFLPYIKSIRLKLCFKRIMTRQIFSPWKAISSYRTSMAINGENIESLNNQLNRLSLSGGSEASQIEIPNPRNGPLIFSSFVTNKLNDGGIQTLLSFFKGTIYCWELIFYVVATDTGHYLQLTRNPKEPNAVVSVISFEDHTGKVSAPRLLLQHHVRHDLFAALLESDNSIQIKMLRNSNTDTPPLSTCYSIPPIKDHNLSAMTFPFFSSRQILSVSTSTSVPGKLFLTLHKRDAEESQFILEASTSSPPQLLTTCIKEKESQIILWNRESLWKINLKQQDHKFRPAVTEFTNLLKSKSKMSEMQILGVQCSRPGYVIISICSISTTEKQLWEFSLEAKKPIFYFFPYTKTDRIYLLPTTTGSVPDFLRNENKKIPNLAFRSPTEGENDQPTLLSLTSGGAIGRYSLEDEVWKRQRQRLLRSQSDMDEFPAQSFVALHVPGFVAVLLHSDKDPEHSGTIIIEFTSSTTVAFLPLFPTNIRGRKPAKERRAEADGLNACGPATERRLDCFKEAAAIRKKVLMAKERRDL